MSNDNFSERLISLERDTPEFRARYEKEIKAMLDKTLKPVQRVSYGLSAALIIAFAVFYSYMLVIRLHDGHPLVVASYGLGILFSVAWTVFAVKIAKSGRMNLRIQPNVMTHMIWAFLVFMQTIFLLLGGQHPDRVPSVFMLVSGLTFLLIGAMFMLNNKIEQSELNMKEKLLGIELRLAEIAEEMEV